MSSMRIVFVAIGIWYFGITIGRSWNSGWGIRPSSGGRIYSRLLWCCAGTIRESLKLGFWFRSRIFDTGVEILGLDFASELDNVACEFFPDGFTDYDDGLGDGLGERLVYELVFLLAPPLTLSSQIGR